MYFILKLFQNSHTDTTKILLLKTFENILAFTLSALPPYSLILCDELLCGALEHHALHPLPLNNDFILTEKPPCVSLSPPVSPVGAYFLGKSCERSSLSSPSADYSVCTDPPGLVSSESPQGPAAPAPSVFPANPLHPAAGSWQTSWQLQLRSSRGLAMLSRACLLAVWGTVLFSDP